MKLPKEKLVIIEWEDSFETQGWTPIEEIKDDIHVSFKCISIGWILAENKRRIIIAPHLTVPNISKTNQDATGTMLIPRNSIISMKKIKLDK